MTKQKDQLDLVTVVRKRSEHNVSRKHMDADALKVLYRLNHNGFTAYLVGGGVRDLLLGRKPKDFDVVTSARPRQIRKLFRNSFLIGRRFRLVHVRFGQNVIETSTFRRRPDDRPEDEGDDVLYHERDNTFGTAEEDALRRDFTINALFYDIRSFAVIDHVGGLNDLDKQLIRCIGDPDIRLREDPVRMVRAARFAARLGFRIEPATYDAIVRHHQHLEMAAPPRLLEEIYRLFPFGSGAAAFKLLRKTGLLSVMFPELDAFLERGEREAKWLWKHLEGLDRRDAAGAEPPDAALLFAVLHYACFLEKLRREGLEDEHGQHAEVARSLIQPVSEHYRMPKRVFYKTIQLLDSQRRFEVLGKRFSKSRFVSQEAFPAILSLREIHLEATGGDLKSLEEWRLSRDEAAKEQPTQPRKRRPRRRRRRGGRRGRPAEAGGKPNDAKA